jgi:hypothetical protein
MATSAVRAPRARVRIAHKSKGSPISRGVAWTRLPSVWLTAIIILMTAFYYPPLKGLYEQRKATSAAKATLQDLGRKNRELKRESAALKRQVTIATEARKLGMISPDEKPFVVKR